MTAKHRNILFITTLVAACALYFLWPTSTATPNQSDDSPATTAQISGTRSDNVKNGRHRETRSASIFGTVIDKESRLPLPGARIAVTRMRLDNGIISKAGQPPIPLVVQSDKNGEFQVVGIRSGQYSLSVAIAGYKPSAIDSLVLGDAEKREGVVFAMQPGGHKLYGRVTDIGGGAVPFAYVRAKDFSTISVSSLFRAPFTTLTNAAGEYELFLSDGRYQVDVFHDDYRGEKKSLSIGGQDLQSDFVLTPGSGIDGRVLRASDESPVENAMVTWAGLGKTRGFTLSGIAINGSALTDAEGRFSLRGLGSGSFEVRAVAARASSKQPTVVELAIAETASDVVVYVDDAYVLSGYVVNKADESEKESGVMVAAYNLSPGAVFAAHGPSAEDGYFEIHGVHPGSYTVGAAAEERLPNFFGTSVAVVDQDVENLLITVDNGNTVSGRVSPPQEAQLALRIDMGELGFSTILGAAGSAIVNGQSDSDGNFILRGVGTGTFAIVATTDDGSEGTLDIDVTEDVTDVVVPIVSRASVRGIVVDSDGKPVAGVKVDFSKQEKSNVRSFTANGLSKVTMTGADGRFHHLGLDDGTFDVTVRDRFQLAWARQGKTTKGSEYEPVVIAVTNGNDPPELHLVVQSRNHTITGSVHSADGSPLPDSWVTARWTPDGTESTTPNRRQRERPVLTDEEGEFRLDGLRAGRYQLWATALHGSSKGVAKNVPVDSRIDIEVKALGDLRGMVSRGGSPTQDYTLVLAGPTKRRIHVQDSAGAFAVSGLEAGKYTVSVSSEEGVATATFTIQSGQQTTQNIALATFGSVSGVLVDNKTGEPIANMAVIASIGKDRSQWAASAMNVIDGSGPRTDEEGKFRIERLNAGKGILLIFDPEKGFVPLVQQDFTLEVGQALDLGSLEAVLPPP